MTFPKVGFLMRHLATSSTIKNTVELEPADGLFPGYSASGQDVWLPYYDYDGPAIVLSAVGAQCGKTFLAEGKWGTVANTTAFAIDTKKASPKFLHYMTNQKDFWEKGGSAQPYVKVSETLRKRFFIPDLATQRQIADFLDRETARIDLLIEKKQRLIHALDEKNASLVNAAVFGRQLPETSGKLAIHSDHGFECAPLRRHLFKVTNGTTATQVEESYGAKRVTRIETISNGDINLEKVGFVDGAEKLEQFVLRTGDVLFSHINSMSVIGNSAIVTDDVLPLYLGMNLLRLRPSANVVPKFFAWCLKSHFVRHQIRQFAKPAINQASISTSNLKRILAPLPDLATQRNIVDFLDRETSQLEIIKGKTTASIDRLKEYRSALITAAVTGQIDVTTYVKSGTTDRRLDAIQEEMGA